MGNFHCIDSSCAEVHYREYLPPVVRWRYEGEDWNEIEADDYDLQSDRGQCPVLYTIRGNYKWMANNAPGGCGVTAQWGIPNATYNDRQILGPIVNVYFHPTSPVVFWTTENAAGNQTTTGSQLYKINETSNKPTQPIPGYSTTCKANNVWGTDFTVDEITRVDGESDDCGECKLTITKNGEIVHEETRPDCPEVEKLDCRLSEENKVIKIEKLPFLERVEVVNYEIIKLIGNVFRGQIPDECLNIYRNDVTGIIPLPGGVPLPYTYTSWELIAQICSAPGCSPPEYQVICNCNCESCPPNTCAVECEGHICCYDEQGIAVKSIAIENYCEVQL